MSWLECSAGALSCSIRLVNEAVGTNGAFRRRDSNLLAEQRGVVHLCFHCVFAELSCLCFLGHLLTLLTIHHSSSF